MEKITELIKLNNLGSVSSTGGDIILEASGLYMRHVKFGNFVICEVGDEKYNNFVVNYPDNIVLKGDMGYVWVRNRKIYRVMVEGCIKKVWIGKLVEESKIPSIDIVYGRDEGAMKFLDKVHRKYMNSYEFKPGDIVAIKSVAGSGKTTTLLELAKTNKKDRILYFAFNRSLVEEIRGRISKEGISNLFPCTFDALMLNIYKNRAEVVGNLMELKPQNIGTILSWFNGKPFNTRKYYVKGFSNFCNQTQYDEMSEYCLKVLGSPKPLLVKLWECAKRGDFISFDAIRKLALVNDWCKGYLDQKYDMIFIDEAQDFDNTMLEILLKHSTIPKLFVGDERQAIYEWRGCINAFDKLPPETLFVEFYSTFRIGEPACREISREFKNCWMISRSGGETNLRVGGKIEGRYVYLFRKWRNLLETAAQTPNIWIANYTKQLEFIKNLHEKLEKMRGIPTSKLDLDDFADDLPAFLLSLDCDSLNNLLTCINNNVVEREKCVCEMHTIHNYKGLENDVVRIFNDMEIPKDDKLYYVALTRGCKEIVLDKRHDFSSIGMTKTNTIPKQVSTSKKMISSLPTPNMKLTSDPIINDELTSDPIPNDNSDPINDELTSDPIPNDNNNNNDNEKLKYNLMAYRKEVGGLKKTPPYRVLSNATISEIVEKRPKNNAELLAISGIGKKKLEEYGDDILKIVIGEKIMDISDIKITKGVDPSEYLCQELVLDNPTNLWVLFDLETTGLSSKADEITQVCFKFLASNGDNILELKVLTSYVRTTKPISEEVSQLTGIRGSDVETAPEFSEVYSKLIGIVEGYYKEHGLSNCIWVAHNGYRFDFPILYRYINQLRERPMIDGLNHWCVDSLDLIRSCEWSNNLESLSLGSVYGYLVGKPMEISHQADADVEAMYEIFKRGKLFTDRLKNIYREKYFLDNKPKLAINKSNTKGSGKSATSVVSLNMFKEGKSVEDIARTRGLKEATIYNHLINCCGDSYITYDKFMDELEYKTIIDKLNSFDKLPNLTTIRAGMPRSITYPKIKLVIAMRSNL